MVSYKAKSKTLRPSYEDDADDFSDDDISYSLNKSRDDNNAKSDEDDDDGLSSISFGALNSAQNKILAKSSRNGKGAKKSKSQKRHELSEERSEDDSESDSDSDVPPKESSSSRNSKPNPKGGNRNRELKKKNKHAPSESSSKRPVSRIREIPGLKSSRESTLYTDIRFDPAYGRADLQKTRRDYAFLDEYRQSEIKNMESVLKDKKSSQMLSERDREDIQMQLQSLKSRLDTMKNRDLETKILADHKRNQMKSFKEGTQSNPYFLKKSEKRKLIQKAKFDTMKASQREKVMERKRKKRLGKEFRQLEFNHPQH
ncbi:uncharacterized protein RJT20DRAFT_41624 [Scheffersomyces xylosifermentans]|uniref:uncharacterized protein n=1 Tax=Scheffersomyces xylosifermentans TaxID=1304137 RepID=UPI00315D8178